MQQFLFVFLRFIDCYLIFALENSLNRSINISLLNNTKNFTETNDFDNPQIRGTLNNFIKWFTPILITFSLLIALVCPFLLWILQEHCLYRSSINQNHRSTTLITTPRLLLIDPRTKLPKSHSPSINNTLYHSPDSSKQINSYYTPQTSLSSSSVNTMV